jgi:hypothetical protein
MQPELLPGRHVIRRHSGTTVCGRRAVPASFLVIRSRAATARRSSVASASAQCCSLAAESPRSAAPSPSHQAPVDTRRKFDFPVDLVGNQRQHGLFLGRPRHMHAGTGTDSGEFFVQLSQHFSRFRRSLSHAAIVAGHPKPQRKQRARQLVECGPCGTGWGGEGSLGVVDGFGSVIGPLVVASGPAAEQAGRSQFPCGALVIDVVDRCRRRSTSSSSGRSVCEP